MPRIPEYLQDCQVGRADVVVSDAKSPFDVWQWRTFPATVIGFPYLDNPAKAVGIIFDIDPDTLILARPGTGDMQKTRNPMVSNPTCASLEPVTGSRVVSLLNPGSDEPFDLDLLR